MGAIPAGYTAGPWLDTPSGNLVETVGFTSYTTEVDYAQGSGGIDPSIDLRAVQCAWELARAGGATGNNAGFTYWGGLTNQVYTCAPIPNPAIGSGSSVGSRSWVGDSINYEGFFGGFLYTYTQTLTCTLVPSSYTGSSWYTTNPTGVVVPTGATLDWDTSSSATVNNVSVTFTPTEVVTGQGCSINVSPIYAVDTDAQFQTATTSGNSFIFPGAGGTAGTCSPGGTVTLSATGAQLSSNTRGVVVIRSGYVDADVPPTTTANTDITLYRACNLAAQMTITATPPRHRFLYPIASVPAIVTSPPVTSFAVTSGNWYQEDGAADLNVVGDGRPLRFYSPSNSTDTITVNFGAVSLGTTTSIGFADVYVIGGGLQPPFSVPVTVRAADNSVIQTITLITDATAFSTWFAITPDIRLAGGCSITFTVPAQTGATFQEFTISSVVLELRTSNVINNLVVQQGTGTARFDGVLAMRTGEQ